MRSFLCEAFSVIVALHCICCASPRLNRHELQHEIEYLLRWRAFWEGEASFKAYPQGQVVEVALAESPGEVAAFVSAVGVAIYLRMEGGHFVGANIQSLSDPTNSAAVERYLSLESGKPGFVVKPGIAIPDQSFPSHQQMATNDKRAKLTRVDSLLLKLPELRAPDYALTRRSPPELSKFERDVYGHLRGFFDASCGNGEIVIPLFAAKDPLVYVYADLGKCGAGIFPFVREREGSWRAGQFSPDKPPNDWSLTIRRIRQHSAAVISLASPLK